MKLKRNSSYLKKNELGHENYNTFLQLKFINFFAGENICVN